MTDERSGLYAGEVVHQRFAPARHSLRYRMFQILFDIDELPDHARRLRFFSHNRFNAFSFHDRDHGDGAATSLRGYVERNLATAGVALDGGRIALLCMPRLFGHAFNPLSVYYCWNARGALAAMIYEVNNTFGQRHTYLIPATPSADGVARQTCAKGFYVSPFMDMDMSYEFTMTTPGETISTVVNGRGPDGAPLIHAAFAGRRRPLTDAVLVRALAAYPFLTLGVVLAIHWEALKLFAKGLRLRRRPPPPPTPVTVVAAFHKTDKQSA
jgi:DUF1365 family protein